MQYYADYEAYTGLMDIQPGINAHFGMNWGCSLFVAMADPQNMVYGRNFDWSYSPALLLFTYPEDGYSSVSMVNLEFLGFDEDIVLHLEAQSLEELHRLMASPGLPLDGINQMGLAVGIAAIPGGNPEPDPQKRTVGSLRIVRELLDHAADVDEAVNIFTQYNIDFTGGPKIHYLVSDASGNAVVVEHQREDLVVIPQPGSFHMATNFVLSEVGDQTTGLCHRYDILNQRLTADQGRLDSQGAMDLLSQVSQDSTQWSIVYNYPNDEIWVAMGLDYSHPHHIQLRFNGR
jgi:choloylglycine hydrolase